jgi:hypothetical protein
MEKKSYLSKTLWVNFIIAGTALFVPAVSTWISGHAGESAMIMAGISAGLRLISKDKIVLW